MHLVCRQTYAHRTLWLVRPGQMIGARQAGIAKIARSKSPRREGDHIYRKLLEGLPAAFYATDAEGYLTFYNEAAAALWGRRPKLGTDRYCGFWKLFCIDGTPMPHHMCPMAIALKENRAVRCSEVLAERPDGTRVTFIPHPTPLHDAFDRLIGATNMLVDISERKQAERALRRQAGLIELSFDAILAWRQPGGIEFWNKGASILYGFEPQEALGKVTRDLLQTRHPRPWTEIEAELREHGFWEGELRHTSKKGEEVFVASRYQLVSDDGDGMLILETNRDITERRRLQQEVLEILGAEQRRIGQDLHDGLCQHLAGIEFRAAVIASQLAVAPEAQREIVKIGELIREGARQARMLSRGLSPVSLEAEGLMSALKELVESAGDLFGTCCHFECAKSVAVSDNVVATHLYRIAQEAISNAARHGRAKSIVVVLEKTIEGIQLSIRDDGCGFRVSPSRARGMGLHTMRYRAELIGATLTIDAGKGSGARVTCLLSRKR